MGGAHLITLRSSVMLYKLEMSLYCWNELNESVVLTLLLSDEMVKLGDWERTKCHIWFFLSLLQLFHWKCTSRSNPLGPTFIKCIFLQGKNVGHLFCRTWINNFNILFTRNVKVGYHFFFCGINLGCDFKDQNVGHESVPYFPLAIIQNSYGCRWAKLEQSC